MNTAIQLGPIALNTRVLLLLAFWLISIAMVRVYCSKRGLNYAGVSKLLDGAVLWAVVFSRLFFVIRFAGSFSVQPWTVFYFWQGGFSPFGAVFGAAGYIFIRRQLTADSNLKQSALVALFAIALTSVGFFSSQWLLNQLQPATRALRLTNFELTDMSHQPVSASQLMGTPLVINFWATWCPPCRREMPLLDASVKPYAAQGVNIVTINVGEDTPTIESYLTKHNLTLPVLKNGVHTTEQVFHVMNGKVMPTTLFINAAGDIVYSRVGELSAATLQFGINKIKEP